ncbi:MAG: peptide chain release factor N(5)-glutamine methyltransferase [Actinomycetota bacterium]
MIKNNISIQDAIKKAIKFLKEKNIESPRIASEILISHVLSIPKTKLYLKLDDFISKDEFEKFWSLVVARSNNIPIQYLTQEVSFLDLKLFIEEGVFIPRPETEILAQKAISILKNMEVNDSSQLLKESLKLSGDKKIFVLDIGTGCGAIGLAIVNKISNCFVYATDINEKALEIAKSNAVNLNLSDRINFLKGNLFEPLPSNLKLSFDLIISNPPYVPISKFKELQPEIREYEPENALLGGEDGLFYYREIISKSLNFLKKNGYLLLEIGYNQSQFFLKKQKHEKNKRYKIIEIIKDLSEIDRVIVLQKEK